MSICPRPVRCLALATFAVVSLLVAGCSGGDDDEAAGHTSTTSPAEAPGGLVVPETVSFDQDAALDDGVVTDEEMAAALAMTGLCLAALGFPMEAHPEPADRSSAGTWDFDIPDTAEATEALAVCRSATFSDLELPYLMSVAPGGRDVGELEVAIRDCLSGIGIDVDDKSLGEIFGTVDPNAIADCAPTAES